jgi:hypothetical protein
MVHLVVTGQLQEDRVVLVVAVLLVPVAELQVLLGKEMLVVVVVDLHYIVVEVEAVLAHQQLEEMDRQLHVEMVEMVLRFHQHFKIQQHILIQVINGILPVVVAVDIMELQVQQRQEQEVLVEGVLVVLKDLLVWVIVEKKELVEAVVDLQLVLLILMPILVAKVVPVLSSSLILHK